MNDDSAGSAADRPASSERPRTGGPARYQRLERLGAGGVGVVYRAYDRTTGRSVALKQLRASPDHPAKRRKLEAMFEREYQTLARLRHPRMIEVYDYGVAEDGPYYVMELLDGGDLQQRAPLPFVEVCTLLRDVASVLALLHAHRLVHRDVSARNIRLTADGHAKLIDFGALHPFGMAADLVGTPRTIAPEQLRRMPLDQRSDLYALGAVAYWALTGRHPYPARRFEELPALWEALPPPPPSQVVADIPAALDRLVSSLLSIDPLSRPSSSAEVIDRLGAIAGLPPEEHEYAAESYLRSGQMVGRRAEQIWIEEQVARALAGHGIEVVLQGDAGIGKTRLVNELGVQAQLRGMVVLKADALATPAPYGVAGELALQLLGACPETAKPAALAHAGVLCRLSEPLFDLLGSGDAPALPRSPAERRALLQTALHTWFLAVAAQRPLLICADNLHAADDASAAFLAALGAEARSYPLILMSTLRTGHAVAAAAPVALLTGRGARLELAPLHLEACSELVHSLFGEVPNAGRLARLLYDKSGGNPQLCMDLVRLLVSKKIATYAGGTWVLPLEFSADELPSRAEELFVATIAALSPATRRFAETLSIHPTPLSLDLCLALSEEREEGAAYAALDELVTEQILVGSGGDYRFAREAMREALIAGLAPETRRTHHRRAGEVLRERAHDDLSMQLSAATHLLRGGEETRGGELLAGAARRFMETTLIIDQSAEQVVQALQAALQTYEQENRPAVDQAELLLPLLTLAYYTPTEWRLIFKYADRAIALGLEITGIARARRLKPLLGRKLGLGVALAWAGLRLAWQKRRRKGRDGYDLRSAIELVVRAILTVQGSRALCLDAEALERVNRELEPLTYFGREHLFALVHEFALQVQYIAQGRHTEVRANFPRIKQLLTGRRVIGALGQAPVTDFYGGCVWSMALQGTARFGDSALRYAEETASLGVRVWEMAADQARLLYHALRGESEQARHYRQRVESFAVQGSTTWQLDMALPLGATCVAVRTKDSVAARRCFEQLRRLSDSVPSLRVYADAAQAGYLAMSDRPDAAIALYESVIPRMQPQRRVYWLATWASFAEVLNQVGQHERARQLMLEGLSHTDAKYREFAGQCLEAERQLALAEAGLGRHSEAQRVLDGLLQEHAHQDQPLLIGSLYKARAEVAIAMDDRAGFEQHFLQMEQRFRATRNPALIAQCEPLLQRAIRAGLLPNRAQSRPGQLESSITELRLESGAPAHADARAADPFEAALRSIVERTQAEAAYLYSFRDEAMWLCAATTTETPPIEATARLQRLARPTPAERRAAPGDSSDADSDLSDMQTLAVTQVTSVEAPSSSGEPSEFIELAILRSSARAGRGNVVGGLIVLAAPHRRALLTAPFLASIAELMSRRLSLPSTQPAPSKV
jgi:hypothetical protein